MNKIKNDIVILGGNHHNSLGLIRSLGEKKCNVYYITNIKKNFVKESKYIKKYWILKKEEILKLLLKEFKNKSLNTIIIPGDDYFTNFIDENLETLKYNFIFPNVDNYKGKISEYMNKYKMNKLSEKNGFLVPENKIFNLKEENIIEKIQALVSFPIIIKPLQSIDGTKNDIRIIKDYKSLKEEIAQLKLKYNKVLIQKYLVKDLEIGVQGISVLNDKKIFIPGIIKKLRQSSSAIGSTTYGEILDELDYFNLEKVENFIRNIKFYGIFDMEFIKSKNKIYFIELNLRNGAYGYAFTKGKINLPYIWCLDAINKKYNYKRSIKKLFFMNEISDFKNIKLKKINLFKWIFQFLKSDCYLILNLKDIKPFIYKCLNKIYRRW